MDTASRKLKLLALVLILGRHGVVATPQTEHNGCPRDPVERMNQCTKPIRNVKKNSDRAALIKFCKALKQAPVCLEQILHQCQGHKELEGSDSLKAHIAKLKSNFDRSCEPLCGPNAKAVSSSSGATPHTAMSLAAVSVWTVVTMWIGVFLSL